MGLNKQHFLTCSEWLSKITGLGYLLGSPVIYYRNTRKITDCKSIVIWENEPKPAKAHQIADRYQLPITRLGEGFLPKLGPTQQEPPAAFVSDDMGIYYDASAPSWLECLIAGTIDDEKRKRAQDIIHAWRTNRISKYNQARAFKGELPKNYILVVDQCQNDITVKCGLAKKSNFELMLDAAVTENPHCEIVVKAYPDTVSRGFLEPTYLSRLPNVVVLNEEAHPVSLIENAKAVYCVTSHLGFEALLWGKKVRTFGMPFYAGWGLTTDELPPSKRRHCVSLENLVHAAFVGYSRYLDPQTNQPCQVEDLIGWIGMQNRIKERFPPLLYAYGFTKYKHQFINGFFQGSEIRYVKDLCELPAGSTLLLWGSQAIDLPTGTQPSGINILRLEDGFLRSVGLGAEFRVRPLSWAVDSLGIYYDATKASELEQLLQTYGFSPELLARAQKLRERIVKNNLTKYNFGVSRQHSHVNGKVTDTQEHRRVILVPGQVEQDASIKFGAPQIRQNIALLRAIREANPEAYVIYKPHPDVYSGLRDKGEGEDQAIQWCDEIVTDRSMGDLLTEIDEVHVLTSLTGFEALLRGKQVTCYGQPFYSGWGLTIDKVPIERRTRRLSVDELVAGALILYPLYLSFSGNRLISPEQAIEELLNWKAKQATEKLTYYQKFRRLIHKHLKKK